MLRHIYEDHFFSEYVSGTHVKVCQYNGIEVTVPILTYASERDVEEAVLRAVGCAGDYKNLITFRFRDEPLIVGIGAFNDFVKFDSITLEKIEDEGFKDETEGGQLVAA